MLRIGGQAYDLADYERVYAFTSGKAGNHMARAFEDILGDDLTLGVTIVKMLDEEDRFIIEKEVVEGKRGNWFLGYYSPASYYRHRNRAYSNFLRCL